MRLWRNNVAQGVVGVVKWIRSATTVRVFPGDAVVRAARILHAGLAEGSPDLVGLRTITIGPEHIGARMAVFVGVEVKSETGRQTVEQRQFLAMLAKRGALAGIARSVDEAIDIIEGRSVG